MRVTCDAKKYGNSAQFDEPSEPERRQPLTKANWLPCGWRERDGGEEKRVGKVPKENRPVSAENPIYHEIKRKYKNFLSLFIPLLPRLSSEGL